MHVCVCVSDGVPGRFWSVEVCMVGVDVVLQDEVVAGVVGRFGGGCPMLAGLVNIV